MNSIDRGEGKGYAPINVMPAGGGGKAGHRVGI